MYISNKSVENIQIRQAISIQIELQRVLREKYQKATLKQRLTAKFI